jgi:hypothetical protein
MLLLRSSKRNSDSGTRMDVLFKDTRAISLPFSMDNLSLSEGTPDLAGTFGDGVIGTFDLDLGIRVFNLAGAGWAGIVVAGSAYALEDGLEDTAPSGLTGTEINSGPF